MPWKHAAIVSTASVLATLLVITAANEPAQADPHAGPHADAPLAQHCPRCHASVLPPTENEEVAKAYATAYIVAAFLEQNKDVKVERIDTLVSKVRGSLR